MTAFEPSPVFVLHDIGDEAGGSAWQAAFEECGWPGAVMAPDLPGHGDEPPPVGGSYELADAAMFAVRVLSRNSSRGERPVVVGVGVNGWPAQVLALGDRAAGLVLVDGLNGPWTDPASAIDAGRRWLRSVEADRTAVAPAPPGRLDPRLRHGLLPHGDRRLAERAAAALSVATLVVESPRSALTRTERVAIVERMPVAAVVELPVAAPVAVADAVVGWWTERVTSSGSVEAR